MKVTIAAVGKMKNSPQQDLMQEFLKRIPWPVEIKEVEAKKGLSGEKLKTQEGELLLNLLPKSCKIIVLDEKGKDIGSEEFANKFTEFEQEGSSQVAFLIGGADGHSQQVREQADMLLSFGKMTWPHMMVRAMLAEQIYRAYSIKQGHPYHRE